jgi:hypothetical protein
MRRRGELQARLPGGSRTRSTRPVAALGSRSDRERSACCLRVEAFAGATKAKTVASAPPAAPRTSRRTAPPGPRSPRQLIAGDHERRGGGTSCQWSAMAGSGIRTLNRRDCETERLAGAGRSPVSGNNGQPAAAKRWAGPSEAEGAVPKPARLQPILRMEPAGIEPATSCLQIRAGTERLVAVERHCWDSRRGRRSQESSVAVVFRVCLTPA